MFCTCQVGEMLWDSDLPPCIQNSPNRQHTLIFPISAILQKHCMLWYSCPMLYKDCNFSRAAGLFYELLFLLWVLLYYWQRRIFLVPSSPLKLSACLKQETQNQAPAYVVLLLLLQDCCRKQAMAVQWVGKPVSSASAELWVVQVILE